jgi:hypothetical protein
VKIIVQAFYVLTFTHFCMCDAQVAFPASIHSLALDYGETSLFAGGGDGRIFQVQLGSTPEERETDVDGTGAQALACIESHLSPILPTNMCPAIC